MSARRCRSCRLPLAEEDPGSNGRCRECDERKLARTRRRHQPLVRSPDFDGSAPAVPVRVVTLEQARANLAAALARREHERALAEIAEATALVAARRAELAELERLMTSRPRGR